MKEKQLLLEQLKNIDVVRLASDLVQIPSYTFLEKQEKQVAFYIRNLFQAENIPVELMEVDLGRFNVTAVLKGTGGGRSLMLSGHLDTVPAYDMKDPFSGMIENGRIYGRGACDMKGPLVSMITAMISIKRSGLKLTGDLYFTGVIDEEEQGRGVGFLIKNGPFTDAAIIGEPTAMRIAIGNRGLEWIRVKIYGRKVHGGAQTDGISAIEMAGRLINRIYSDYAPAIAKRKDPILGPATINIGRIAGGDQPSTVAGSCVIDIDRRWIREENIEQVYRELNEIISDLSIEDNRFRAEVESYFDSDELPPHKPFCTAADDPIVLAAIAGIEQNEIEKGKVPSKEKTLLTSCPCWTDAGMIAALTNTKCLIMGPGEMALAHTPEESIGMEELVEAANIYALIALEYCNVAKETEHRNYEEKQ